MEILDVCILLALDTGVRFTTMTATSRWTLRRDGFLSQVAVVDVVVELEVVCSKGRL